VAAAKIWWSGTAALVVLFAGGGRLRRSRRPLPDRSTSGSRRSRPPLCWNLDAQQTGGRRVDRQARRKLSWGWIPLSEVRATAIPELSCLRSSGLRGRWAASVAICAGLGLLAAACGGSTRAASHGRGSGRPGVVASGVRLSITPAGGGPDAAPDR